jgi:hypothetical protein
MKVKSKLLLKAFSQAENENFTKMVSFNTKEIEELSKNLSLLNKNSDEPKEGGKNEKSPQKSPAKSAIKKQPVFFDIKEPQRNSTVTLQEKLTEYLESKEEQEDEIDASKEFRRSQTK